MAGNAISMLMMAMTFIYGVLMAMTPSTAQGQDTVTARRQR